MTVKKALKEILSKVYFVEIAGCVTLVVRCANTLESIVAYPSDSYLKRRCTYVEVFFQNALVERCKCTFFGICACSLKYIVLFTGEWLLNKQTAVIKNDFKKIHRKTSIRIMICKVHFQSLFFPSLCNFILPAYVV